MQPTSKILSGLMGLCVGDALGVPVEFTSRAERVKMPITEMTGYGTYNQPPGTWSDDSSLTFCLADSLCTGFSLEAIAKSFCRWYNEAYWTPYGEAFDVGNTTRQAITNLQRGVPPLDAGLTSASSNGNGSLMRILPLSFYYQVLDFSELIERVHQVSRITHGHWRSQIACGIYTSIAIKLLQGLDPKPAYLQGIEKIKTIYTKPATVREINSHFQRVFSGNIDTLSIDEIQSSGYVIHTLEAALWSLLNTSSYAESVLKAVNLGEDTDTTAAVTGGLAGIYYGLENIPKEWVAQIARKDDIVALASRLEAAINSSSNK
ncbi:MAG: ADP-ribosylglycohydrolase family protein [Microcoleus vaginatus WJT46-NPBG5]|jgi:ADP-ribosylglycohydrolase|nr:ADP-ribosylglycohydrolase family protein [Microcoleus vaginatus WJT46-NPBG5]